MDKPLLRTKLHRPPMAADTVRRTRLHEAMNRASELPLTLVSAPAGYGKSTMVSHWAESLDEPCAWLSLDTEDSDLAMFVRYLLAAVQTIVPDACPDTQALCEASNPVPLSVMAGNLANELDAIDSPFVLVIDDYHRIDPTSDVHELIRALLDHPPRNLRLVVATRSDPPYLAASLRLRGRVEEVRLQDLKFTAQECFEYVTRSSDLSVSDEALANLERQTEGWIVALRLVSLHLRQVDDPEAFLRGLRGGVQQTREYLLVEVLERMPARTREGVLKTALLDRFCAELCDEVCAAAPDAERADDDGQHLIETLLASNLFIIPLDAQGRWFRYHHLFQEMLRDQLNARVPSGEINSLHLRASEWLESEGLIDEALKHALAAEDIDLAVRIVDRHRHPTLNADRWYILAKWLSLMPAGAVQQHPELLIAQAWVLFHHFRFETLFPLLDQLETMIAEDPARDAMRGEILLCRGYGLFFMGDGEAGLKLLTGALKRMPEIWYEARAQAEVIFALSTQMVGREHQAIQGLDKLLAQYNSPEELRKTRLLITYVFIHIIGADLTAADLANQRVREVVERGGYAYVGAWCDHLQGVIHLQRGECGAAVEFLERAVAKRFIHFKRAAMDSIAGLMLARQALGQDKEARSELQVLREYTATLDDPTLWPMVSSIETRLALMQGQHQSAVGWLDSIELPPEGAMLWWVDVPSITRCRLLIAEGSPDNLADAETRLGELLEANETHHNTFQMINILALQAMLFEKQSRTGEALACLGRALAMAQPGCLVFPFLELGAPMTALLAKLPPETASGPLVERVLSAAGQPAGPINVPLPNGLHPADMLTIREQEILELLAKRLQYKEIAGELFISPQTVNSHLKNVYQKLGVSNRRQAVARALELGLLPPPSTT